MESEGNKSGSISYLHATGSSELATPEEIRGHAHLACSSRAKAFLCSTVVSRG
jgi:hypothetical protein